jgi:hypothetical protein
MSVELSAHVIERLWTDTIMWLSIVRPDGRPHSVPLSSSAFWL